MAVDVLPGLPRRVSTSRDFQHTLEEERQAHEHDPHLPIAIATANAIARAPQVSDSAAILTASNDEQGAGAETAADALGSSEPPVAEALGDEIYPSVGDAAIAIAGSQPTGMATVVGHEWRCCCLCC